MKTNYPDNEEFFSLWFYVDKRVLIPRNDTETMVYQSIKACNASDVTLIDVGTGSSAILTSTIKNIKTPLAWAFWLDISLDALDVAKINIEKHGLQNQVILTQSDLLEVFINGRYSFPSKIIVITANLPYIKNGDFENMDQEVLENEPHIALFWGEETGFEMYEKLIEQIIELKKIHSLEVTLFIEIGFDQYEYSQKYFTQKWFPVEYFKDLWEIWRIVKINI